MTRFDLGRHTRRVTTTSPEAQYWCDMGLNWCYGFNHEEGVACFERALAHDPDCVMAHWGAAYGVGPFYNNVWRQFSAAEADQATRFAWDHLQAATGPATEVERGLVEALKRRFQQPHAVDPAEFDRWDQDYADAMRGLCAAHPGDRDVAALCAEALMTRTAWKLWDLRTGAPLPGADTLESLAILERVIAADDAAGALPHPAILHLHIHCTEMSGTPEQALRSADRLGELCPDAGHMNHMPGHTYVLCGAYEKARIASEKAVRADDLYVDYAGPYNFYTTARAHDLHLLMYACMFLGQWAPAEAAAERIRATLTRDVLSVRGRPQLAVTMEGYYSMSTHVLVRFGRWEQIVARPLPDDPELYCVTMAMHRYARVVAHAALGRIPEAEAERAAFHAAVERVPEARAFFNNPARVLLGVAESMLEGELAYHSGHYTQAYAHLREAVRRCDALAYSEPWPWMHPPRHALGALLAAQGHFDEAEAVYRADLGLDPEVQRCAWHPGNVWALHGLVECLRQRGAPDLAKFDADLERAMALTDVPIGASCMCRASARA